MTPKATVTDAEVETFWRDGVVCLRGAPRKEHHRDLVDGDHLGTDAHPLVWS